MTKEQEQAIEYWKSQLELYSNDGRQYKTLNEVLNLIQQLQAEKDIHIRQEQQYKKDYLDAKEELEQKDKIIDEITEEIQDHIGFENRLKRDNREPDAFNQGRFYVANNINNILKRK